MNQTDNSSLALVLYGNGGHLGAFKAFVDSLVQGTLSARFPAKSIVAKNTITRDQVFQAMFEQPAGSIQELHIFSHSIGGGLYPGYEVLNQDEFRSQVAARAGVTQNRKVTYEEALNTEVGGILTDHLLVSPLANQKVALQAKFAKGATAKFWGCNSGVSNWVYTDLVTSASGAQALVSDPNVESAPTKDFPHSPWREYYWRAFNTRNTPKPSIAQALATFLGVQVFGASSGAHIEVSFHNHWVTSNQFKNQTGRWPGRPLALRLQPDRGDYAAFRP